MLGQCAGDFSLGVATQKEAKVLADLWVGPDSSYESGEDEEMNFKMSKDGLRRYRDISFKGNVKMHQINFERRPDREEEWTRKLEVTKPTHANGHLTIADPHDEAFEDDDFLSLKTAGLTAPQLKKAYSEIKISLKYQMDQLQLQAERTTKKIDLEDIDESHVRASLENVLILWNGVMEACYKGLNAASESGPEEQQYWQERLSKAQEKQARSAEVQQKYLNGESFCIWDFE